MVSTSPCHLSHSCDKPPEVSLTFFCHSPVVRPIQINIGLAGHSSWTMASLTFLTTLGRICKPLAHKLWCFVR